MRCFRLVRGVGRDKGFIPIAEPKFTKNAVDDPLLKVPPASRGNRTRARFPSRSGGNLRRGVFMDYGLTIGITMPPYDAAPSPKLTH